MRVLVAGLSAGAALAFIAASGSMNWVFMTSLGKSDFERQILGAVSVAVSAYLALLPTLLVWAFRERRTVYIVLGIPVFFAFGAFSLSSAVGFAAKNRGSLSEDRAYAASQRNALKLEIERGDTKLKAFAPSRPLAVIEGFLHGLEQDRRWQSSKSCQDATADASRTFCKSYFDLKAEAALSGEAARVEARIADLKTEERQLDEQGAGREADNQAAVLGSLFGWNAQRVERALMLFLAVLVEIGAALGLYFATGHLQPQPLRFSGASREPAMTEGRIATGMGHGSRSLAPAKHIAGSAPRRVPRLGQL